MNLDGVLEVAVTKTVGESTVARMIALVTQAQAAKAPSERFSAWFGQRYSVAVMAGAIVAFAAFYWLGRDWEEALYRAATLLVAASPCAIVISVPAAILSALSAAARGGVLFKGGAALETLAAVDTFAFDKTGTLTTGKVAVTSIVTSDHRRSHFGRSELLCWPRDRLAPKAGIGRTMLKRIEEGAYVASIEQRSALRAALEDGGVEFTNGDTPGVRLKVKARKTT